MDPWPLVNKLFNSNINRLLLFLRPYDVKTSSLSVKYGTFTYTCTRHSFKCNDGSIDSDNELNRWMFLGHTINNIDKECHW